VENATVHGKQNVNSRPLGDGALVHQNVHAVGALVHGAVPWRELSGNGLALATGLAAADAILEERAA